LSFQEKTPSRGQRLSGICGGWALEESSLFQRFFVYEQTVKVDDEGRCSQSAEAKNPIGHVELFRSAERVFWTL